MSSPSTGEWISAVWGSAAKAGRSVSSSSKPTMPQRMAQRLWVRFHWAMKALDQSAMKTQK